ncbi:MAG: hypothetical protein ACR2LX_11415 [Jatrophihabitans sp.]
MLTDPIVAPPTAVPGPRRHRAVFWGALVVAVAVLAAGVVIAVVGYIETSGPAGTVRGYFAALARSDAPAALAFGRTPAGERELLTSRVLAEQQRIAPIGDVSIGSARRSGNTAQVDVHYTLRFFHKPQKLTDTIEVRQLGGDWRLVATAVETSIGVEQAPQRASILGAAVPRGKVLMFPGAVPIRFDSPYLTLKASDDLVSFASGPTADVYVDVSDAGEKAVITALTAALRPCLTGGKDPRCPQPTGRTIPGTVKAAPAGPVADKLSVDVGNDPEGTLDITGTVHVTGTYRSLGFDNRTNTKTGAFDVPVHATAYAVAPVQITWVRGP